jgi:hypothetical protein
MDNPVDLKEVTGFTLITTTVLLGMTTVLSFTHFLDSFWILRKGQRNNSLHVISQKIGKCFCALYNLILTEPINSPIILVHLSLRALYTTGW